MIGKILKAYTPFYDATAHKTHFKARPALVIAQADADDFVILPVSKISVSKNINPTYDIKIDPNMYPLSNLTVVSYVRTHKQCVIHRKNLGSEICDLKSNYEELYMEILIKRDEFSAEITNQAI